MRCLCAWELDRLIHFPQTIVVLLSPFGPFSPLCTLFPGGLVQPLPEGQQVTSLKSNMCSTSMGILWPQQQSSTTGWRAQREGECAHDLSPCSEMSQTVVAVAFSHRFRSFGADGEPRNFDTRRPRLPFALGSYSGKQGATHNLSSIRLRRHFLHRVRLQFCLFFFATSGSLLRPLPRADIFIVFALSFPRVLHKVA